MQKNEVSKTLVLDAQPVETIETPTVFSTVGHLLEQAMWSMVWSAVGS